MSILKYSLLTILIVLLVAMVLVGILTMTRGGTVRTVIAEGDRGGPPQVSDPLFPRTIELFTGTHIEPGNRVEILLNGEGTYPSIWKDIASAKKTVTLQMYYSQPGAVADTMAKYLSERARAGVRVLVLLDAFGSQPLKKEWLRGLRDAGVEVAWLRPLQWYTLHKATQRSHVRVLVVDGRVGYTGGFGLADYWLGDGRHKEQSWRLMKFLLGRQGQEMVCDTGLAIPVLKSVANSLLSQYTVTFTRPVNTTVKSTQMETAKGGKVLLTPWMK